jgi:undecaprenyl phosphate-alpha-L-ara4FN deformylase
MSGIVGLRIDVDTELGFSHGVPSILELLHRLGVHGTFFIVTGHDIPLRTLRRGLYEDGFIKRVYSLSGGFLKGGFLRRDHSIRGIIKDLLKEKQEIGLHGYYHFKWQNHMQNWSNVRIDSELRRGIGNFSYLTGFSPRSFAVPGWVTKEEVFLLEQKYRFDYCSDTRGVFPFYPLCGGRKIGTLQIPVTMPTLDELISLGDPESLLEIEMKDRGVYCAHAEFEGMMYRVLFERFLKANIDKGYRFVSLVEIKRNTVSAPSFPVEYRRISGRTNVIAVQAGGKMSAIRKTDNRE